MRPILLFLLLVLISSFVLPTQPIPAWGFFGHRKINRQAVFILPTEMMGFFKENIGYLTDHAIDADKRRYVSKYEAVRHYIDLDVYGEQPFEYLPRNWTDALIHFCPINFVDEKRDTLSLFIRVGGKAIIDSLGEMRLNPDLTHGAVSKITYRDFRRFFNGHFLPAFYENQWEVPCDSLAKLLGVSADSLTCEKLFAIDQVSEHGVLPWHLQNMLRRLTTAFVEMDANKIRRLAADMGHYLADAHVPLHTTENYNGQLTGQTGIHAFWESRLPELFAEEGYDFWVGKAQFIERPADYFWEIVLESHSLVDSVLAIELDLRERFPTDQQICHELKNDLLVRTQCREFAAAYHERMGGMVEKRMREAILAVGSAWYTAWVLAGQPDLNAIGDVVALDSVDSGELEVKRGFLKNRGHE